ncbi:MAG: DUF4102 domain-containing protein [Micavibrio sp.]|nr:DUF4102 domain-containing protein [Micavibrio sp.]
MPKVKITKTAIDEAAYPDKGQVFLWDTELKGFGVCISRSSKTFIVQRDVAGISKRITIGRYGVFTPDQARKLAIKNIFLMTQGVNPNEEKKERRKKSLTLDELAEEFLKARSTMKPRTKKDYRYCLDSYLADWLHKPVTDITAEKFQRRYFYIGENNGKTCANNVRRILSAMINYGMAAHGLFDKTQCGLSPRRNAPIPTTGGAPISNRTSWRRGGRPCMKMKTILAGTFYCWCCLRACGVTRPAACAGPILILQTAP